MPRPRFALALTLLIAAPALGRAADDPLHVSSPIPLVKEPKPATVKPAAAPKTSSKKTGLNAPGSVEDGTGWIASSSPKRDFQKKTGFPNGRDGYVVDYIVPLKDGGADTPENMKWMTLDEVRARAGVN